MAVIIEQFICRTDNFGVLIHDEASGLTASIDAPESAAIVARLKEKGWKLDHILTTHHHVDHTEGNLALKQTFGATITGPAAEADRVPGIDRRVSGGDIFRFGAFEVRVIDTPGHTLGHITYWLPDAGIAFVGDTLFALGCGRVIEGTADMMWASLEKLQAFPDTTEIYCGHEYTEANARFALTIEPDNVELAARAAVVTKLRAAGRMTLPTTMGAEKRTNPFLRAREAGIRSRLGMADAAPAQVFAEIRKRKDTFR
jgi:hydroxyacylglutathione hydrolase